MASKLNTAKFVVKTTPLCIAWAIVFLSLSCSTAPKNNGPIYQKRNQAADYGKQADSLFAAGNYPDALSFYRRALENNISIDHDEGVIVSRNAIGRTYAASGLAAEAKEEYDKALALAKRLKRPALQAQSITGKAELLLSAGKTKEALALLAEAQPLASGDEASMAIIHHNYGIAYKQEGNYPEAITRLNLAMILNIKLKRLTETASNYYLLSSVHLKAGNLREARLYAQRALQADKKIENSMSIASDYYALGKISLAEGKDEEAYFSFEKAFSIALVQNMAHESLRNIEELIILDEKLGKTAVAVEHKALRDQIRAILNVPAAKAPDAKAPATETPATETPAAKTP